MTLQEEYKQIAKETYMDFLKLMTFYGIRLDYLDSYKIIGYDGVYYLCKK